MTDKGCVKTGAYLALAMCVRMHVYVCLHVYVWRRRGVLEARLACLSP